MKRVTLRNVFAHSPARVTTSSCPAQGLLVREYYRGRYDLVRADKFSRPHIADCERPSDPLPALTAAVGGLGIRPTEGFGDPLAEETSATTS